MIPLSKTTEQMILYTNLHAFSMDLNGPILSSILHKGGYYFEKNDDYTLSYIVHDFIIRGVSS